MRKKIGIDLGGAYIRTVFSRDGEIASFPAKIALDGNNEPIGFGEQGIGLAMATPGAVELKSILPENGRLPDFKELTSLFSYIIKGYRAKNAEVYLSLAKYGDELEKMAVDALQRAGAGDVFTIHSCYAAMRGCNVKSAGHSMIVNIGKSLTDMAVYFDGKEVKSKKTALCGSSFTEAICSYLSDNYRIIPTEKEAESIKAEYASLSPASNMSITVKGRSSGTGLPKTVKLTSNEIASAIEGVFDELTDEITALIRGLSCEPDRIILVGGGALLNGIDSAVKPLVCLPTEISSEPQLAVIRGLSEIMTEVN